MNRMVHPSSPIRLVYHTQTENTDVIDITLRLTLIIPDVHVTIVGMMNPDHHHQNVSSLATGPFSETLLETIRDPFQRSRGGKQCFQADNSAGMDGYGESISLIRRYGK